jgi:hypothetical protein
MLACDQLGGNAVAGPAAGVSRRTLCLETLACVESTSPTCAVDALGTCYCGSVGVSAACLVPGNANGTCKAATERGLETTDPQTIASNFTRSDLGAGAAYVLVQCLGDLGCDACFH